MRAFATLKNGAPWKQFHTTIAAALVLGLSAIGCGDESIGTDEPSTAPDLGSVSHSIEEVGYGGYHEEEEESSYDGYVEPVRYGKNGLDAGGKGKGHNPSCGDVYEDLFECKIDPISEEAYSSYSGSDFADYEDMSTYQRWACDMLNFKIKRDGETFDWKSEGPKVDAICVKGGPGANCYEYENGASEGKSLNAFHEEEGKNYGLSHITVCLEPRVEVSKTAETSAKRKYEWSLEKTAKPDKLNLFKGDTQEVKYTVKATRTKTDKYKVTGKIKVANFTPYDKKITDIRDKIHFKYNGYDKTVAPDKIKCFIKDDYSKTQVPVPDGTYENKLVLEAGETLVCKYKKTFTENVCGYGKCVNKVEVDFKSGETKKAKAYFKFPYDLKEVGKKTLEVKDSNGETFTFYKSGYKTYKKTFDCDEVDFGYKLKKHISHTNYVYAYTGYGKIYDKATVDILCSRLKVKKTAKAKTIKKYEWWVKKYAEEDGYQCKAEENISIDYKIVVGTKGDPETKDIVKGEIKIYNPNPYRKAHLKSVEDKIALDYKYYDAKVDCHGKSYVQPESVLTCDYYAVIDDQTCDDKCGVNKAKVKQINYDFDAYGNATESGTTKYIAKKSFCFEGDVKKIDECVYVFDKHGYYTKKLGKVCAWEVKDYPKVFKYTLDKKFDECGEKYVKNTAKVVTLDTKTKHSDTATVKVDVECEDPKYPEDQMCTTDYWKNNKEQWCYDAKYKKLSDIFYLEGYEYELGDKTLYEALSFENDYTKLGAVKYLLSQAVAAYLSACSDSVDYPMSKMEIVWDVWWVLYLDDEADILELALELEYKNKATVCSDGYSYD